MLKRGNEVSVSWKVRIWSGWGGMEWMGWMGWMGWIEMEIEMEDTNLIF